MSAYNRLSLLDDLEKSSQFMILSKQTQMKLLEKKVKGKSDLVALNLTVLRKLRGGESYNIFEIELFNDFKYQEQEIYETLSYEGQEDGRIQESIDNNNATREYLMSKQAIIEKCLNNSPTQRIENQMKTFFEVSKNFEEFLLNVVECKAEFQREESNALGELECLENKEAAIEDEILDVEKEFCVLEQTDNDIDLEFERFKKQVDLFKANEKELCNLKLDMENVVKELQEKNNCAAEQESSIANINGAKRELISESEELIVKKTKIQDNIQQLEIQMELFSNLMMQVTNKAEIFQLESDDQFLCILTNDEYLESKLKLESLLTDNQTLNNELELTQLTDESAITLSNNLKLELKLKEDEVTEKEKKIQFIEDDLRVVNEKLKQRLLKSEEDDKMMVRLIQELKNEAENKRMEEFYGQQTFNESNVRWNQKYKEELDKINKLKREGTSKKRKSTSSSSAISVKQMKRQSFESGLDEHTDEEDDFNITFNTDSEF